MTNNTSKRALSFVVALVGTVVLSGCHGGEADATAPTTGTPTTSAPGAKKATTAAPKMAPMDPTK